MYMLRVLLCISLFVPLVGCDNEIQKAENIMQQAIDELATAKGNYKEVLQSTADQLAQFRNDTVKAADQAVQEVSVDVLGATNTAVQCAIDEMGVRTRDALVYIKLHTLMNQNVTPPTPWVCWTKPDKVELKQLTPGGSYILASDPNEQLIGVNFRHATLPTVKYTRAGGQELGHMNPLLNTPYLLELNLQSLDLSQAQPGDQITVAWPSSDEVNQLPIILHSKIIVDQAETVERQFYAPPSGIFNTDNNCVDFSGDQRFINLQNGWTIERNRPGTLNGIIDLENHSNNQANQTLHNYNYFPVNDTQVEIQGTVCGAHNDGPGAIFDHIYQVWEFQVVDQDS